MMKKIIPLILAGFLPLSTSAEDLQCTQSYDIFNEWTVEHKRLVEAADTDGFLKFQAKILYTSLFQSSHLDQTYMHGVWLDKAYVKEAMQNILAPYKDDQENFKFIQIKYKQPKANFISEVGELCIIPTVEIYKMEGERIIMSYDVIFVRNLISNQWLVFAYTGLEKAEDFKQFFPNFPKQIKLAQAKINGFNEAEYDRISSIEQLKKNGESISSDTMENINFQYEQTREKLKQNGF